MKVAIFHDYFTSIGGGEKLALTMARYLDADVITTEVDRRLISLMGFDDVNIIGLGDLSKTAPLRQVQATIKFALCDFRGKYDFFIFSGNWAHHASRLHHPNLFYCHTPVRAFYDRREIMASAMGPLTRVAFLAWASLHGYFDRKSIARVEKIACNSQNTALRVQKYLGKDSMIIYPPCDTSKFKYVSDDRFWLSVNRLYPEKRIEVQIEAFRGMPEERLIIIGNSGKGDHSVRYAKGLKERMPSNVMIVSDVPEQELTGYYGRCRGLIATAADEDFGMTAVEAMASGKPIIAAAEGGYLETVIDGVTGQLINPDVNSLIKAIKEISRDAGRFKDTCIEHSKKFDVSSFNRGIDAAIKGGH